MDKQKTDYKFISLVIPVYKKNRIDKSDIRKFEEIY